MPRVTVAPIADDKSREMVTMAASVVEDLSQRFNVHDTMTVLSYAIGIVHHGHTLPGVSAKVAHAALLENVGWLVDSLAVVKVK